MVTNEPTNERTETDMPVPRKRKSKARTRQGRAHKKLTLPSWITCKNCDAPMQRHHACPSCGQYLGRAVVEVETE